MDSGRSWRDIGLTRRLFINGTFLSTAAAIFAGSVFPIVRYLMPGSKSQAGKVEQFKMPLSDLHVGEARFFKFNRKPAILIRKNDQEVIAMSAVCTHLGCVVKYASGGTQLKCPCHGAKYDLNGKVLSGPAPRPLKLYAAVISGEKIVVEEA